MKKTGHDHEGMLWTGLLRERYRTFRPAFILFEPGAVRDPDDSILDRGWTKLGISMNTDQPGLTLNVVQKSEPNQYIYKK